MENKKPKAKKPVKKPVKKPAKKPVKRGAPSKFTEELFSKILNRLSFSELSLRKVLSEVGIEPQTFYNWLEGKKDLIEQYTRAKTLQAEFLFDMQREIAFERSQDHTPFTGANVIQRDKLIIDTIKWQTSKLNPKKYSERIEVDQKTEVSGEINHVITGMIIVDEEEKTEEK